MQFSCELGNSSYRLRVTCLVTRDFCRLIMYKTFTFRVGQRENCVVPELYLMTHHLSTLSTSHIPSYTYPGTHPSLPTQGFQSSPCPLVLAFILFFNIILYLNPSYPIMCCPTWHSTNLNIHGLNSFLVNIFKIKRYC